MARLSSSFSGALQTFSYWLGVLSREPSALEQVYAILRT